MELQRHQSGMHFPFEQWNWSMSQLATSGLPDQTRQKKQKKKMGEKEHRLKCSPRGFVLGDFPTGPATPRQMSGSTLGASLGKLPKLTCDVGQPEALSRQSLVRTEVDPDVVLRRDVRRRQRGAAHSQTVQVLIAADGHPVRRAAVRSLQVEVLEAAEKKWKKSKRAGVRKRGYDCLPDGDQVARSASDVPATVEAGRVLEGPTGTGDDPAGRSQKLRRVATR